jgi:hypothetical protein
MTRIIFRDLPVVSAVERQLQLHARDRLFDDDIEELPHFIDDASVQLFGITQRDTFYWALPSPFAHNTAGAIGNRTSTCLASTAGTRMLIGAPSTSIFAVRKAAGCIASKCSGVS